MSADHGSTPAAWTAVVIVITGFVIGGVATILMMPIWMAVSGGIIAAGAIVGRVMQLMGLGQRSSAARTTQAAPVD